MDEAAAQRLQQMKRMTLAGVCKEAAQTMSSDRSVGATDAPESSSMGVCEVPDWQAPAGVSCVQGRMHGRAGALAGASRLGASNTSLKEFFRCVLVSKCRLVGMVWATPRSPLLSLHLLRSPSHCQPCPSTPNLWPCRSLDRPQGCSKLRTTDLACPIHMDRWGDPPLYKASGVSYVSLMHLRMHAFAGTHCLEGPYTILP